MSTLFSSEPHYVVEIIAIIVILLINFSVFIHLSKRTSRKISVLESLLFGTLFGIKFGFEKFLIVATFSIILLFSTIIIAKGGLWSSKIE